MNRRTSRMAQQAKVVIDKPEDLSWIHGTHMVEVETLLSQIKCSQKKKLQSHYWMQTSEYYNPNKDCL